MRRKRGFSLIELIMAIMILGIIAGVGAPLIIEVSEAWIFQTQRKELSESARIAMDRMIREIRRILDRASVITANSTTFQFIDIDNRNITFGISGTVLTRSVNGIPYRLASNISSLSFTYYDSAGAVIATPTLNPAQTDIRRIAIDLTFSLGNQQLSFSSSVSPRRLQ